MSVDLSKMPKLGFGLMRLPELNGEIDLDEVCRMVDFYMDAGLNLLSLPGHSASWDPFPVL